MMVLLFLCVLCVCGLPIAAKELPRTAPEKTEMSSERLARINAHMQRAVDDGTMVGGMALIARNGKLIFEETWGQADREKAIPMGTDTIFRLYSMSKPITSVALMTLYEEGRFELDDPIAKYIPQLADLKVALSSADTVSGVASDGVMSRGTGNGDQSLVGQTRAPAR